MTNQRTFGQKIGIGFALIAALAALVSVVGVVALYVTVADMNTLVNVSAANLEDAEGADAAFEEEIASFCGFLLTKNEGELATLSSARQRFSAKIGNMRPRIHTERGDELLRQVTALEAQHYAVVEELIRLRQQSDDSALPEIITAFEAKAEPLKISATKTMRELGEWERTLLEQDFKATSAQANRSTLLMIGLGAVVTLLAIGASVFLTRQLSSQLGGAIQHIQTSASQLNSVAAEQASSTTEQTAATTEASTTLKELVSTSKQMSEGAQRVTRIAEQAAKSARGGEDVVNEAQRAVEIIQEQVGQIVEHMLELSRKSQQVGSVLELINELSEQTNILAINATIESAGASESGARFGAVAQEIRKLADRVGSSTKEVRALIEDIRAAANTTVMATEDGSKAVDAGTRQFAGVVNSFREIVEAIMTTTDASREIELGTRQQVTAVEQVSGALLGIETAATQNERASRQLQEVSANLLKLSVEIRTMVGGA